MKIFLSVLLLLGLGYIGTSYAKDPLQKKNFSESETNHEKIITVKYRGNINVNNGYFQELNLRPSSFIKSMHYDKNNNYLLVRLKNTYYHYCSIPQSVVSDWRSSSSLGRYYNYNIKGNYDCRVYPVPNY